MGLRVRSQGYKHGKIEELLRSPVGTLYRKPFFFVPHCMYVIPTLVQKIAISEGARCIHSCPKLHYMYVYMYISHTGNSFTSNTHTQSRLKYFIVQIQEAASLRNQYLLIM